DLNAASQLSLTVAIWPGASQPLKDPAIASDSPNKQSTSANIEFTLFGIYGMRSNENKLSCGEQERARLRVEGLKSSENLSGTPARRQQERLVRCVHGFTGCSGAIKSSAATICHFPLRLTQVSVQTK